MPIGTADDIPELLLYLSNRVHFDIKDAVEVDQGIVGERRGRRGAGLPGSAVMSSVYWIFAENAWTGPPSSQLAFM